MHALPARHSSPSTGSCAHSGAAMWVQPPHPSWLGIPAPLSHSATFPCKPGSETCGHAGACSSPGSSAGPLQHPPGILHPPELFWGPQQRPPGHADHPGAGASEFSRSVLLLEEVEKGWPCTHERRRLQGHAHGLGGGLQMCAGPVKGIERLLLWPFSVYFMHIPDRLFDSLWLHATAPVAWLWHHAADKADQVSSCDHECTYMGQMQHASYRLAGAGLRHQIADRDSWQLHPQNASCAVSHKLCPNACRIDARQPCTPIMCR